MKRFILLLTIVSVALFSCKKKNKDTEPELSNFDVNFYKPTGIAETNVPLLTLKNDKIQITAIGNNSGSVQGAINKLYISDTETKTEWILLVENSKPKFLYGINSSTEEKLPFLYSIENTSSTAYILRYYDYDWVNRLGTLKYEVNVANGNVNVAFKTQAANTAIMGINKIQNSAVTSENKPAKIAQSFPAPVLDLNRLLSTAPIPPIQAAESLDEQFDRQVGSLMNIFKETITKAINAPCTVSKVVNSSDKNFVCIFAGQINKYVHEKVFEDLDHATDDNQADANSAFEGSSNRFNLKFFKRTDIVGDLKQHLNDIRDLFSDNLNFDDWSDDLSNFNETKPEDLDDLSDKNGVIHIGLSWDTTSDIDLHVTDPRGETIWYNHESSNSGGYLDRDDINGFGPENIYWMDGGPDGTYKVQVDYYGPSNGPSTKYVVKIINGLGFVKTFEGTLTNTSTIKTVATFSKTGQTMVLN